MQNRHMVNLETIVIIVAGILVVLLIIKVKSKRSSYAGKNSAGRAYKMRRDEKIREKKRQIEKSESLPWEDKKRLVHRIFKGESLESLCGEGGIEPVCLEKWILQEKARIVSESYTTNLDLDSFCSNNHISVGILSEWRYQYSNGRV